MKTIFLTGLLLASGAPSLALADTYLETGCSTSVQNGGESYCDNGVSYFLDSDGSSTIYSLRVTAPPTHCSPVKYLVAFPPPPPPAPGEVVAYAVPSRPLDPVPYGHNNIGMTGVLRPGESAVVDLGRGYDRGTHELMIMVIGLVQDCNAGQIHSWGVSVAPMIVPE